MPNPNPVGRLDAAMEERRLELNLEWREIAERGGLTYETLRALRRSGKASPLSKRRAETGLQWAPGSVDAVLAGGDAVALAAGARGVAGADEQDLLERIAELEDELEHLNPRYERNRPSLVAHLQRQIDELRRQLNAMRSR